MGARVAEEGANKACLFDSIAVNERGRDCVAYHHTAKTGMLLLGERRGPRSRRAVKAATQ